MGHQAIGSGPSEVQQPHKPLRLCHLQDGKSDLAEQEEINLETAPSFEWIDGRINGPMVCEHLPVRLGANDRSPTHKTRSAHKLDTIRACPPVSATCCIH